MIVTGQLFKYQVKLEGLKRLLRLDLDSCLGKNVGNLLYLKTQIVCQLIYLYLCNCCPIPSSSLGFYQIPSGSAAFSIILTIDASVIPTAAVTPPRPVAAASCSPVAGSNISLTP